MTPPKTAAPKIIAPIETAKLPTVRINLTTLRATVVDAPISPMRTSRQFEETNRSELQYPSADTWLKAGPRRSCLQHDLSAIDVKRLAGQVIRLGAGEKNRDGADVPLGIAKPPKSDFFAVHFRLLGKLGEIFDGGRA